MKTLLILLIVSASSFSTMAQSHRFRDTFTNVAYSKGQKVSLTYTTFEVRISNIGNGTYGVQVYAGSEYTTDFDFRYKFNSFANNNYEYECINCGRGEISRIDSNTKLSEMAKGSSGTITITIIDYLGRNMMSIVCRNSNSLL